MPKEVIAVLAELDPSEKPQIAATDKTGQDS